MITLSNAINTINSLINEQEIKFYVKKGGHWHEASRHDLLFFRKKDFAKNWPKKKGDLIQTSTWKGYILAIFVGNKNNKDIHYTVKQLERAERFAPNWLKENSNIE